MPWGRWLVHLAGGKRRLFRRSFLGRGAWNLACRDGLNDAGRCKRDGYLVSLAFQLLGAHADLRM